MVLMTQDNNPNRGSIPVGKGDHWGSLPAGPDTYVLTASANDSSGTGLVYVPPYALPAAITATSVVLTGGIAVNGVASPPVQAALPTTLAQVIAILVSVGLCASS